MCAKNNNKKGFAEWTRPEDARSVISITFFHRILLKQLITL
jgi:hypothetical protein